MSQENEIFSFFKSGHCLNVWIKFATLHIAAVIYNLTVVQVHIDLVSYNFFNGINCGSSYRMYSHISFITHHVKLFLH